MADRDTMPVHVTSRARNRAGRYEYREAIRVIKLPKASFKGVLTQGNNSAKARLCLFLLMCRAAKITRSFTASELARRAHLKQSYLARRGAILSKWGYVERKGTPRLYRYVAGKKTEKLISRLPEWIFQSLSRELVVANSDLFGGETLYQEKQISPEISTPAIFKLRGKQADRLASWLGLPGDEGEDFEAEQY